MSSSDKRSPLGETPAFTAEELADCWRKTCQRIRLEYGEDVYAAWFGRLQLERVNGRSVLLVVPTKFLKSWIQSHYADRILAHMQSHLPALERVTIGVRSSMADRGLDETPAAIEPEVMPPLSSPAVHRAELRRDGETEDAFGSSPLDRRLTFATFLVGNSNRLAFDHVSRIPQAGGRDVALYNPLFIHAAVGLGKTHLLQAVALAVAESGRRVIYLTAEKFMYGFVSALKAQTALAFKEQMRAIDVLIIDDIQFLTGKSIQNEFCHTLNALIDSGKQILVAADRRPGDLEQLDERARSRLNGGLCLEIMPLEESLRLNVLRAKVANAKLVQPGFDVSPAVLAFVASSIETNGRDLDGAVNRLLAHATLNGAPLSIEQAEIAIRDLVRMREPRRVKIEEIQKLVGTRFSVSRADILSSRRTANVVRPRQIAMYLAKTLTLRSLPEIGRRFGGRDHTTVLHAVRKIEGLIQSDMSLSEEIELLRRRLLD